MAYLDGEIHRCVPRLIGAKIMLGIMGGLALLAVLSRGWLEMPIGSWVLGWVDRAIHPSISRGGK